MGWARDAEFTGHRAGVYALQGTRNDPLFLSASGDGKVVRWDRRSPDRGELVADALKPIWSMLHDVERDLLFIGNSDGGLHVVDLVESEELRLLQAHQRGIFRIVALGPDRIACTGGDGFLSVWKVPSMELERRFPLSEMKLRGMAVDPAGSRVAIASLDGMVRILETEDLNEHHTIEAHPRGAASVRWHPRKPLLVSGGRDGYLRFWRSDAGFGMLYEVQAHRANIYAIAFSPDGSRCATASRDRSVKMWDAETFDPVARFELKQGGHTHSVNTLLWCSDGSLLSGGDDKRILHWQATNAG